MERLKILKSENPWDRMTGNWNTAAENPLVAKRNRATQTGQVSCASHSPASGPYWVHLLPNLRIRLPNVVIEQMSPATVVIEQTIAQTPRMRRLPARYWMLLIGFSSVVCMVMFLSGFIVAPSRFLSLPLDLDEKPPLMNGRIGPPS